MAKKSSRKRAKGEEILGLSDAQKKPRGLCSVRALKKKVLFGFKRAQTE